MPSASRNSDELSSICKQAEALAARRRERPSTLHLLLTLSAHDNVALGLLDDHRLSTQKLEILASSSPLDEDSDATRRVVQTARDLATRTKAPGAGSAHVLLALLGERRCAAYGLLERCGVDLARLRMGTMQIAVGATTPRRVSLARAAALSPQPAPMPPAPPAPPAPQMPPASARPGRGRAGQAIAVSVVPTPRSRIPRTSAPPPPQALPAAAPQALPAATPQALPAATPQALSATGPQVMPRLPRLQRRRRQRQRPRLRRRRRARWSPSPPSARDRPPRRSRCCPDATPASALIPRRRPPHPTRLPGPPRLAPQAGPTPPPRLTPPPHPPPPGLASRPGGRRARGRATRPRLASGSILRGSRCSRRSAAT
jgi:hypothetical protein